jgi:tRNA (cytidine/uridine-2'-O-)-methyltransferase
MDAPHLPPPPHKVALLQPQIAPNTGNIARLCVATGTELHLVRPLGFILSDQKLRRSAMDYWPRLRLTLHDDLPAFLSFFEQSRAAGGSRPRAWMFSTKGEKNFWSADYADGDFLVFGSETAGLPASLLARDPDRVVRIPQASGERCLNLSTAAGIGLFEAIRRLGAGNSKS